MGKFPNLTKIFQTKNTCWMWPVFGFLLERLWTFFSFILLLLAFFFKKNPWIFVLGFQFSSWTPRGKIAPGFNEVTIFTVKKRSIKSTPEEVQILLGIKQNPSKLYKTQGGSSLIEITTSLARIDQCDTIN